MATAAVRLGKLMATGALAVGDGWLGSVFSGSLLSRLSRRFGEGMVNAALTARVGRATIDVRRPLPFNMQERPKISVVLRRVLTSIFDKTPIKFRIFLRHPLILPRRFRATQGPAHDRDLLGAA